MLSVGECARLLGVSDSRVRALIASRMLPATKVGRSWVIREEDAVERLESHPSGGRPATRGKGASGAKGEQIDVAQAGQRERSRELHQLYRECRRAFAMRPDLSDIAAAGDADEAAFYMAVADFFLQRKQAEIVKAGVY